MTKDIFPGSINDIISKLIDVGSGSLSFKKGISCDFKQLKVDPGVIDLY